MLYRKIGKSGAKVSAIGFGSWTTIGGTVDKRRSNELIKYAFENGINFFDTADVYAIGNAEKFLGDSLKKFKRQDLFIASKCFWPMSKDPNDRGLSRKHITESVNRSLINLKTDYIDLYQCHRYDIETPVEETCRAFNTLIEQGKILYWGVSEWSGDQIREAVVLCNKYNLHKPISNQPQYSLLYRNIETNGVLNYCEKEGIGQVVWSPLAQGVLTGKYNKKIIEKDSRLMDKKNRVFVERLAVKENLEKVAKLIKVADELNSQVSNIALAWCLRKKIISSVITSATKISQLKENINASELELSDSILKQIDKIFKIKK